MRRPIVIGLVALSVALNLAFVGTWLVHALTYRGYRLAGPPGFARGIHARLDLSEEQQRQIDALIARFQGSASEICSEVPRRRSELFALLAAEPVDREAVAAKRREIAECQHRMQELVIEHILAERAALTPSQREEFFRMLGRSGTCPGHGPLGGGDGRDNCPGTFGE